ncbi:MAG: glycosyltransferase, partial [Ruminococcus sp.]|nr:glycosyltransferase [Ruminococcus sp.]
MLEQIGVCQGIRRENMFTVSVIITFYNQEKYVDATMQSVLDQKTDFDFEIIAGDDGSSDRTVE